MTTIPNKEKGSLNFYIAPYLILLACDLKLGVEINMNGIDVASLFIATIIYAKIASVTIVHALVGWGAHVELLEAGDVVAYYESHNE